MVINSILEFEVVRDISRFAIDYRFIFEGDRPDGEAYFALVPVFEYFGYNQDRFKKLGAKLSDIVGHITWFYPNGQLSEDELKKYERQGIGSRVLEIMINDAREYGANFMFALVGSKAMFKFIREHGFEPGALQVDFYKRI